jgi:putative transposase
MPRKARLDAPGTLHHIIGRGIERVEIFRSNFDRDNFLSRVAELCRGNSWTVYAWALMPNHFHLLIRTGQQSISQSMRKLLTGYVVNFNRRHKRYGHLFQNRYKSIICQDDPYLLELARYIHLNPLRAGLVESFDKLNDYPWSGHSTIMERIKRDWQDTHEVLAYFGERKKEAIKRYEKFLREGIAGGKRPDLIGGGLVRSLGGWSQVLSMRRRGEWVAADERILGGSDFTEQVIKEAAQKEKETLRFGKKKVDLLSLAKEVARLVGIEESELQSGSRSRKIIEGRKLFCQAAVRKMGYSGADVARFVGMTTSAVNRLASSEAVPELEKYLKVT